MREHKWLLLASDLQRFLYAILVCNNKLRSIKKLSEMERKMETNTKKSNKGDGEN